MQFGILVADYFLFAATFSFSLKFLADRRDPLKVMSYGVAISSFGSIMIAVASGRYVLFLVWLSICGLAAGIIQPATNAFLSREIHQNKQGIAFGIKQSGTPASTLLGGLALPLVALTIGWQFSYVCAFCLGVACLTLLLIKLYRKRINTTDIVSKEAQTSSSAIRIKTRMTGLTLITFGIGLGSGTANTYGAFFVSTNIKAGFNPKLIGYLFAISSVLNLITRVILGNFADRNKDGKFPSVLNWVVIMFFIGSFGYLFQLVHNIIFVTVGSLLAAILGWGWPGLTNLAIVRRFPTLAHRATGISQAGVFLGAMAGPIIFGAVDSNISTNVAWTVNFMFAILAAVTIAFGKKRLYKSTVN